jgi:hypothetical protein
MSIDKYDELFKSGELVCPRCGFDHEGFEYGADFPELQGIETTTCAECELDFNFELTFKIKVIKDD